MIDEPSALERTFLAYIRTSIAFSMQGVLIAQLFHLYSPESDRSGTRFTYAAVGVPLSVTFQSCAIVVAILGAARFWRQQTAIARGKVFAGGWELNAIGGLTMSVGVFIVTRACQYVVICFTLANKSGSSTGDIGPVWAVICDPS